MGGPLRTLLALVVLLALLGVAYVLWPRAEQTDDVEGAVGGERAETQDAPSLKGAAGERTEAAAREPRDPVAARLQELVGEACAQDAVRRAAARKEIEALHAEHPEAVRAIVGALLERALGAGEKVQEAIGDLIVALSGGRYGSVMIFTKEHVPALKRIYEAEGATWGIKRSLIDLVADLGADGVPLVPALVGYIEEILADRRVAAKEAQEAGIMVSWDHVEYTVQSVLVDMGASAVPALVDVLRSRYDAVGEGEDGRWEAPTAILAGALAEIGEDGIRALLELAADPRARVRNDVAWALRDVKGPHEAVRGVLVAFLDDEDDTIRAWAAESLARHGSASIPDLRRALRDPSTGVRREATKSLGVLGVRPDDVMEELLVMLEGKDRRAAIQAAETIAGFGEDGVPALPRLLARMNDPDAWLARMVGAAAGRLVPRAPEAVVGAWATSTASGRRAIVDMLVALTGPDRQGRSGTLDARLQALLRGALRDADPGVRVRAAAHLAPGAEPRVIEILRAGFDAKDGEVRTLATDGLGRVGGAVADLLPRMIGRLEQEEGLWRPPFGSGGLSEEDERSTLGWTVAALGRFDNARMLELLDHETWEVGYAAQESFGSQGVQGLRHLTDAYDGMRPGQKKEALDIAASAFFRKGEDARRAAARALVRKGLADADPHLRLEAVEALRKDEAQRVALALPVLTELLATDDEKLLGRVAYQLGALGEAAAPARDAIEARLANTEVATVRSLLGRLLRSLDGDAAK